MTKIKNYTENIKIIRPKEQDAQLIIIIESNLLVSPK